MTTLKFLLIRFLPLCWVHPLLKQELNKSMSRPGQNLSGRLKDALYFAAAKHRGQPRKGTCLPYISHPVAVAGLVAQYGGGEDEIIGGLLHDVAEDAGGHVVLEEIRQVFGRPVADIVEGCSDSLEVNPEAKLSWCERKAAYIEHLKTAPSPVLLVSNCDKLHNASCILADLKTHREALWERFSSSKEDNLWYYGELATVFLDRRPESPVAARLDSLVGGIRQLAGQT